MFSIFQNTAARHIKFAINISKSAAEKDNYRKYAVFILHSTKKLESFDKLITNIFKRKPPRRKS